jgi:hypothetical protein
MDTQKRACKVRTTNQKPYFINYATSADIDNKPGKVQTKKFPSDNECGHISPKVPGEVQTQKFPSDNESGNIPPKAPGDLVMTQKFPSDNESGHIPPKVPGNIPPKIQVITQLMNLFLALLQRYNVK